MASRPRQPLPILALAVLGGVLPASAAAQAPGYQQIDTRSIMAEYNAEVIEQVNRVMGTWGEAWADDDADAAAGFYWENAVLIPYDGTPLRGQDAIREYLSRTLPDRGRVEAFMLDFDASGGMAVVYGNYMLDDGGTQRSGPLVTVYMQRGRTWKIRSQVFVRP
jgi:uncharacterized protein (TIGR02246 family)